MKQEKIIQIMLWSGLTYEEAKNSWALKNFEEAKKLREFFDRWIAVLKQ